MRIKLTDRKIHLKRLGELFSDLVLEHVLDDNNVVYSATACLKHFGAIESKDTRVEHDTLSNGVQILEDLSVCYIQFLTISFCPSSTSFIPLYTAESWAASVHKL